MLSLTLIRHAKSSWEHPQLTDHQRPLNPRGLKNAQSAGKYLREKNYQPDKIFCSDAERAKATAEIINQAYDLTLPLVFDNSLYTFNSEVLWQYIIDLPDTLQSIALLGHNPAITDCLNRLAKVTISDNIPTCGVVELQLPAKSWQDIDKVAAAAKAFYTPKKILL